MKMLKKIIAVFSLIILAGSAHAIDRSRYNGNVCKAYYGSQTPSFYSTYKGIKNTSLTNKIVTCPIVADAVANTTGTYRTYINWTGTGTLQCVLRSMYSNGTTIQYKSGADVGGGWLTIQPLTSESYWGSFSLYCSLPSKARINTIVLHEKS